MARQGIRDRAVPTWEANWLLSENGADPYLEDPASLWLLHWWLLSPPCAAPTWWVTLNTWGSSPFRAADLAWHVNREVTRAGWSQAAPSSVGRDIDCLTRMYTFPRPASGPAEHFEDMLNCPFKELGLLAEAPHGMDGGHRQWRLSPPDPDLVPAAIVAYACLDYAGRHVPAAGSVSLSRLAREPGQPQAARSGSASRRWPACWEKPQPGTRPSPSRMPSGGRSWPSPPIRGQRPGTSSTPATTRHAAGSPPGPNGQSASQPPT